LGGGGFVGWVGGGGGLGFLGFVGGVLVCVFFGVVGGLGVVVGDLLSDVSPEKGGLGTIDEKSVPFVSKMDKP